MKVVNEQNHRFIEKKHLQFFFLLFLVVFFAYANSLVTPFHLDDPDVITNNSVIKNIDNLTDFSTAHIHHRHILLITYALNYQFGELNPFGYHLFNVLLHYFTVIAIFLMARITMVKGLLWEKGSACQVAALAALLFALNPAYSEAVTYIGGRGSGLAAFFYFTACILFIAGSLKETTLKIPKLLFFISSLLAFLFGVLSKETTLTFPLICIVYDYFFMRSHHWVPLKVRLMNFYALIPLPAIAIIATSQHSVWLYKVWLSHATFLYFIAQIKVICYALKELFLPINLSFEYDIPNVAVYSDPTLYLSAFFLLAILFLAIKKNLLSPVLSFAILWFFITLVPTNSVFPRPDLLSDRNLYLPYFGFALFLSFAFHVAIKQLRKLGRPAILTVVSLCLFVILLDYSVLLIKRNKLYMSNTSLWGDTYEKTPKKLRVLHNLAIAYMQTEDYYRAFMIWKKTLEIYPYYNTAHLKLAQIYLYLDDFPNTEKELTEAIRINPKLFEEDPEFAALYKRFQSSVELSVTPDAKQE